MQGLVLALYGRCQGPSPAGAKQAASLVFPSVVFLAPFVASLSMPSSLFCIAL